MTLFRRRWGRRLFQQLGGNFSSWLRLQASRGSWSTVKLVWAFLPFLTWVCDQFSIPAFGESEPGIVMSLHVPFSNLKNTFAMFWHLHGGAQLFKKQKSIKTQCLLSFQYSRDWGNYPCPFQSPLLRHMGLISPFPQLLIFTHSQTSRGDMCTVHL